MSDPTRTIHLELPLAQVQVIFMCLNKGQFDYVEPTVVNIRSQVQEQLDRSQPPPASTTFVENVTNVS